MTSTYPRPFLAFLAPAFLPPALGGPRRSSIELALLMLVPGRLGGPGGGPAFPLVALLLIAGGAPNPPSRSDGGALPLTSSEAPSISEDIDEARGEGPDPERDAEVKLSPEPPGGPLTLRGGPVALGGGGVAEGVGVFSAPAFLLTHRFKTGSYTNELVSPSFARIGLFGCDMSPSFFAPPPNHPPIPQPFLAGWEAAAFAAKGKISCRSWKIESGD